MKHIFKTAILMACAFLPTQWAEAQVEAGSPAKIWTNPVVYRAQDQVTWYFDMTDTKFKEAENLYLWTWAPSEPDAGNWEHSSDFAKLTYEGDNIYSFTLVPEQYYGVSAADINANNDVFWARLKNLDGTTQSDVFQVNTSHLDWQAYIDGGQAVQAFPEKFSMTSPLSILVDISKFVFNGKEGGLKDIDWQSINFHSGLDDWSILQEVQAWIPEQVEKTKFTHVEGDIYRKDLVPATYYGVESDYEADNIAWLITTIQPDWAGTGDGPKLKAAAAVPYPDPQFSVFPSKFCAHDVLTLTRQYNGKTDGDLTYTLTVEGKEITGILEGNRDKRSAVINLQSALAGVESATQLHLTITNTNGVKVVETSLPLVSLSEITFE